MNAFLRPARTLAAWGFVLSAVSHCLALARVPNPVGSFVWLLHAGIFVVWLPTVIVMSSMTRHARGKDFWKIALAGCPVWMRRSMYAVFCYGTVNFFVFMGATAHLPKQQQMEDVMASIRGFSGHWMMFYGAAFAVLYSRLQAPGLFLLRKCPQGHEVSPGDSFCAQCGHDFSSDTSKG